VGIFPARFGGPILLRCKINNIENFYENLQSLSFTYDFKQYGGDTRVCADVAGLYPPSYVVSEKADK
jgi:hypothetical protein